MSSRKSASSAAARLGVAGGPQSGVSRMGYRLKDRSSSVSRYFSEIREFPILSRREEQELAASLAGKDQTEAINKLVESNLAFVVSVAADFRNSGLSFEDLINEGNVGLVEAARHFDPSRGNRFISYAVWWIKKSIHLALYRDSHAVRIPKYQIDRARQVGATQRDLARKLGRKPDRQEVSRKLQSTIARVDELLQLRQETVSLDEKTGRDKDTPLSESLVDLKAVSPEEGLLQEESQELIRLAVETLTDQEQTVIIDRFGLHGGKALTLREIGKRLGVTAERVRQIEAQAMRRLRKLMRTQAIASPSTPLRPLLSSGK
ncbi:MAG TPA: RNA polymerase sigma factor RpoD/SigA [Candidatus Polarisedimenticolia bacterium]|nr:RNA polymerase sigma factor RpoD/SigA [Candidatus Polarisedimenticolia bacterium]